MALTKTTKTQIGSGIPKGIDGSVLFIDNNIKLAQDNANLFWDNSNNRLGIGTVTPSNPLEVFPNTDVTTILGRCKIGSPISDYVAIAHHDRLSASLFSILIAPDGQLWLNAGAGEALNFRIGNVTKAKINSAGRFQIQMNTPISTGATFVANTAIDVQRLNNSAMNGPQAAFTRARGAEGSPTAVLDTVVTGLFNFRGYDGSDPISSAQFGAIVDDTVSSGVVPQAIFFNTGTVSSPAERMRITSVGDIEISTGDLKILTDNKSILFGAAQDFGISYTGLVGNIDSSLVAPSDIEITCGANKTIELINSVFDDMQFPLSGAKVPASNAPTWETFTANTNEYSFDVDDFIDTQANEMPHAWKEGTNGRPHLHVTTKVANSTGSDRFAKFTIWIAYNDTGELWQETSFTAELTIPTGTSALHMFYLDMGADLDLTNYILGAEIKLRAKRIAATGGTEYAGRIFLTQAGVHVSLNTLGSRQETVK